MPRIPKDYSRHENIIIFNLSLKRLCTALIFISIAIAIFRINVIPLVIRFVLEIPIVLLGLFATFYKTAEGDDFGTYIFNLITYYWSPKYLVYKREIKKEQQDEKKNR